MYRSKTASRIVSTCATFSAIVLLYLIFLLCIITYFNAPNSYHREDKRFVIERGMTLRQVVEKLHDEEIIKSPGAFLLISQLIKGLDPKVRYGEYFMEKNISYYKILKKINRGFVYFHKITIPEGFSIDSAVKFIESAPGLVGKVPENLVEGSLLPETYFYSYNDNKLTTVKRMQDAMTKVVNQLWETRDPTVPLKNKQEAIILASIVERETSIDSERGKVASVFTNRLRKGMKLQSDPTIIYSFTKGNKDLEHPIRVSDIQNNSPFNTYHIYGLPPTPICNPGFASIKAVLNPLKTDYLFFVASGNGGHIFSSNIADHNSYVAQYRRVLKERVDSSDQSSSVNVPAAEK